MLTHRGFSAWIVSEGKTLREFEVVVDSKTNKVSCWIPCEVGKTFTIHWMDHGSNVDSAAYINLDGFTVPGRFLYGLGAAQRGSVRTGDRTEREFQFATVEPANTSEGRPSNANKDVGTIVLKIKLIKRTAPDHPANGPLKPPKSTRIKRSGSEACVSYGVKRTSSVQHDKTWSFVPYDKSTPGAHVQFVFRYRTQDFLLDQGIVSPDDLIEPVVDSVAPDLTTDDEQSPRSVHGSLQPQQQTPPSSPHGTISPAVLMKPIPSRNVSLSGVSYLSTPLASRQNSLDSLTAGNLPTPQFHI